jgi:hypothetical protein
MIQIDEAIKSLRPGIEWSMDGQNVEGITWHTEGAEPLTTTEVQAEVKRLEKAEADKIKTDQVATAAAIAHAKSLGFTDQMISVMYPNLGAGNV